ncbi:MAG: AAA family ATPase [SAR324 cluster bacterium]|nr:AAA family ATPase [SAR324 cluster bacterium]
MIYKKDIWTFGGSKGGVGKSLICSNIGLYLAQRGYKVLLVDADFGSANLHTYLGISLSSSSLSDFLITGKLNIQEVITDTKYKNLSLITGGEDSLKISNLRYSQVRRLIESLHELEYDYILIDIGAGTSLQTVDVFTEGKKLMLVCTPEPAAIENLYRLLKYSFFRSFKKIIHNHSVRAYLEQMLVQKQADNFFYPHELIENISTIDKESGKKLQEFMITFNPKLILNMVSEISDIKLGFAIVNSCKKYFGLTLDYIGFIERDERVLKLVTARKPVIIAEPFIKSARGFRKISEILLGRSSR